MGGEECIYNRILMGKPEGKRLLGRPRITLLKYLTP
jgi:hypothetical protein